MPKIEQVEKRVGKLWMDFTKEYADWVKRKPKGHSHSDEWQNAMRDWEEAIPEFDYSLFSGQLEELAKEFAGEDAEIEWDDQGEYIPEQWSGGQLDAHSKPGYTVYHHLVMDDDEIVGHIYERYYDNGKYALQYEAEDEDEEEWD